jgi:glycine cleavage system H protein
VAAVDPAPEPVLYRRARLEIRLPADRLYTASHAWLARDADGAWRVGLTPFAVRMLGEPVEHQVTAVPGSRVRLGDAVGWIEGFKAVTELASALEGEFAGGNPALDDDVTAIRTDAFGAGWLYRVRGDAPPGALDARAYAALLDRTVDGLVVNDMRK